MALQFIQKLLAKNTIYPLKARILNPPLGDEIAKTLQFSFANHKPITTLLSSSVIVYNLLTVHGTDIF